MNYKLTIDINLMHEDKTLPAMDTLIRWKTEGKLDLIEAEPPRGTAREPAYGWPGSPSRPPAGRPRRAPMKKEPPGPVNFNSVARILFPGKNSQKLSMGEINGVAHMIKHYGNKNEIFVTGNVKDFIDDGKRDRLKSTFGIIAMTPDEAVEMLSKMEGWK